MLLHTIVLLFCCKNNSVDYYWDACYFAILWFTTGTLAILLFMLFFYSVTTTGTLAILLFMLFCYSVITTGSLAILLFMLFCYSMIFTTGTLAILLFCDYHWVTCYFAIPWFTWHWDACYFAINFMHAILWCTSGTLAILLFMLFCYSVTIRNNTTVWDA